MVWGYTQEICDFLWNVIQKKPRHLGKRFNSHAAKEPRLFASGVLSAVLGEEGMDCRGDAAEGTEGRLSTNRANRENTNQHSQSYSLITKWKSHVSFTSISHKSDIQVKSASWSSCSCAHPFLWVSYPTFWLQKHFYTPILLPGLYPMHISSWMSLLTIPTLDFSICSPHARKSLLIDPLALRCITPDSWHCQQDSVQTRKNEMKK